MEGPWDGPAKSRIPEWETGAVFDDVVALGGWSGARRSSRRPSRPAPKRRRPSGRSRVFPSQGT